MKMTVEQICEDYVNGKKHLIKDIITTKPINEHLQMLVIYHLKERHGLSYKAIANLLSVNKTYVSRKYLNQVKEIEMQKLKVKTDAEKKPKELSYDQQRRMFNYLKIF